LSETTMPPYALYTGVSTLPCIWLSCLSSMVPSPCGEISTTRWTIRGRSGRDVEGALVVVSCLGGEKQPDSSTSAATSRRRVIEYPPDIASSGSDDRPPRARIAHPRARQQPLADLLHLRVEPWLVHER